MRRPLPEIPKYACIIKSQTSIPLTYVCLISCLFTWLCAVQDIFRVYNGCVDSPCLQIWIHQAYCLLFLQLWAVVVLKLQFLTFLQDNLLQYFHYISSNRALSQLFVFFFSGGVHCAKKKRDNLIEWIFGRKLPKLYWWTLIFMEMFQCSRVDLQWNWLIFNEINQSVHISNRFFNGSGKFIC